MGVIDEVAAEIGSSAMIYVPSFVEIGSDLRKVTGED
jgi:hypothetical protein